MPYHRRRLTTGARAALVWGLACFAALQVFLAVRMDRRQPELRDPEYGYKLARLRQRLADEPDRPLVLILGSSRSALGLAPLALPAPERPVGGKAPIVFNFALTGSGPILELLCLHRLLRAGIRPNRVIIEVLPPVLHQEEAWAEMSWMNINRLSCDDVWFLRRYTEHPWVLGRHWLRSRLTPWFSHRFCVLSRFAAEWLPWSARQDGWRGMDAAGWLPAPFHNLTAEEYQRKRDFARDQYGPPLEHFHITTLPDQALRELLQLCRQEGIAALLLLMPEGTEFQSWYPPGARERIDAYLGGLSREYGVPLIDTRCWMPDTAFFDSHHLLARGAATFTERFAHAILNPVLEGKTLATGLPVQGAGTDLVHAGPRDELNPATGRP